MHASPERRAVASKIGIITRYRGEDAPELAPLRRRLNELRIADIRAWADAAAAGLPDEQEFAFLRSDLRRMYGPARNLKDGGEPHG
jgi:hypothetical protein